jgi:hypothetical protein
MACATLVNCLMFDNYGDFTPIGTILYRIFLTKRRTGLLIHGALDQKAHRKTMTQQKAGDSIHAYTHIPVSTPPIVIYR